jgi:dipeptidyl aminopeptidase/acylaminoacyl peptidase
VTQSRARAPELEFEGTRQVTDDTFFYEYPAWSPDGKKIAIWRYTLNRGIPGPVEGMELVLVDVSSGELEVIAGPGESSYPTWSPGGTELAAMIYRPSEEADAVDARTELRIFSTIDGTWRLVQCEPCGWPNWLSDGTILVAANLGPDSSGQRQLGTARVDPITGSFFDERPFAGIDSNLNMTSPTGEVIDMGSPPRATADGNTLLLPVGRSNVVCSGIWSYALDSEGPVPLIDSPDLNECDPALSHDDTRIAYTTQFPGSIFAPTALVVANSDGSSPQTLLDPGGDLHVIRYPAWSPDGTQIAFVYGKFSSSSPAYSDLYIVDVPPELRP